MTIHVASAVLVLVNGLFLAANIFGLPGNWFMVILTWALAVWQWERGWFGLPVLITIVVLAVIGEVLEFIAGAAGVKRVGGSKRAMTGAIIGGIVGAVVGTGAIPIPLVGSLVGACAGAFLGAAVLELSAGKNMQTSVRAGVGAGIGRFLGLNLKVLMGLIIWILTAVAAFWP